MKATNRYMENSLIKGTWLKSEEQFLVDNYHTKGRKYCVKHLNRNESSVQKKISSLSLYRYKKNPSKKIQKPSNKLYGTSIAEIRFFFYLEKVFGKNNVLNRHKINGVEADIFIKHLSLAIEYDGAYWHKSKVISDIKKNNHFDKHNISIIRIREIGLNKLSNEDIIHNYKVNTCFNSSSEKLFNFLKLNYSISNKESSMMDQLLSNDLNYYILPDEYLIYPRYKDSLEGKEPIMCTEWDYDKNKMTPDKVQISYNYNAHWKCSLGHEFKTRVNNRVTRRTSCHHCKKDASIEEYYRKLKENEKNRRNSRNGARPGYNFAESHPDKLSEWDWNRNVLNPFECTPKSNVLAYWVCCKCGNEWHAKISGRVNGNGCPDCNKGGRSGEFETLNIKLPELLRFWDYSKNLSINIFVTSYSVNSNKRVNWKCPDCEHEFFKTILNMTRNKSHCPECKKKKTIDKRNITCLDCGHTYDYLLDGINRGKGKDKSKCPNCYVPKTILFIDDKPHLAHLLHPTKNDINSIYTSSTKKVHWIGVCGHEWASSPIVIKCNEDNPCPTCKKEAKELKKLEAKELKKLETAKRRVERIKKYEYNGVMYSTDDIYNKFGISKSAFFYRKKIGNTGDDLFAPIQKHEIISFAHKKPEFLNDWNDECSPYDISHKSSRKVSWKCSDCNHEWKASVRSRSGNQKCKCPNCASLGMMHPELAKDWSYRNDLTPFDYASQSGKKVWWECHKCGHEWERTLAGRTRYSSCPGCRPKIIPPRRVKKIILNQNEELFHKGPWLELENNFLKENYPHKGRKYCAMHLNRKEISVQTQINKHKLKRIFKKQ